MERRLAVIALLVAVLAASAQLGSAKITKAKIRKDDRSLILMAEPFGFGVDGWINITVWNFALRQLYDTNEEKLLGKPHLDR